MTLAHMRPGLSDARQLLSNLFNNRSDDFFESAKNLRSPLENLRPVLSLPRDERKIG